MQPEVSLLYSQKPLTSFYPGPDESTLQFPHSVTLRSTLILSSHLRLGLPNGLVFQLFILKFCMHL
jgi:hypothetical protein